MLGWTPKSKVRRQQVREQRARRGGPARVPFWRTLFSWPTLIGTSFCLAVLALTVLGYGGVDYVVGQYVDRPIYAQVDFQVPDPQRTAAARKAARAKTPSYYSWNPAAITLDRVRADLIRLYQAAANAPTFEEYAEALKEMQWPAEQAAYERLRQLLEMPEDGGRALLQEWVQRLPLDKQFVVRALLREPRDPPSTTDFVLMETKGPDAQSTWRQIPHAELILHGNERALRAAAEDVARAFPASELWANLRTIIHAAYKEQPNLVFNQERTTEAMREAEASTPEVLTQFERGKPFINPGVLGSPDHELLTAHHAARLAFLKEDDPAAKQLRRDWLLQRAGLGLLAVMLSVGLMVYTRMHQPPIFQGFSRPMSFVFLLVLTVAAARLLQLRWPDIRELVFIPCLVAASILAIAYPRRFALGVTCMLAVLVATVIRGNLTFLLALLAGAVTAALQLHVVRTRTKLISSGLVTAVVLMVAVAAGGLLEGHATSLMYRQLLWSGGGALLAAFVVSGVLPFLERFFHIATSLTLLEWRDPTRPLLQLLAREAPGTYNHSLVLGTLAEAACERIGANGLLTQVGALYHDIGKINKADYFAENQEGKRSRHENLAPTMSLLIILGHVKDGLEMAREYKLPPVLWQFIEEHHGSTVVRYFHHMASEKQPQIASGRHDREVSEAEFRYPGPKPRSRESAVLLLCDGVEGAVRSLNEPTVGRIESVVHQIVTDRLNDGQFDDCDITLKEIRLVEESLVKSLCSIYHGRVAYPKTQPRPREESSDVKRVSASS